ncbi:hypothetical protein CEXT_554511 [Caerostris extrusa]|uniref:LAGLIDADG homing endonuclease n=1 Tax=Caerostris extrusa TaxID=172846 RepID=A0AAV4NIR4_CAEEX|nr:hypothetical protein CEXT_554511 [Caerostris extrusa]
MFQGIIDSDAKITVLRRSVMSKELLQSSSGSPTIGSSVEMKIPNIPFNLWEDKEDFKYFVQVRAARVEGLFGNALVTPDALQLLEKKKKQRNIWKRNQE